MAANRTTTDTVLAKVRATPKPDFIRVIDEEGNGSQIRTPDVKRWKSRVSKILDTMQWRSICPVDSSGAMMGPVIENPDYEEFSNDLEDISGPEMGGVIAYLDQMLKAQGVALDRQSAAYESVLKNNQVMMDIQMQRTISLEKTAHDNFETIKKLHEIINESGEGEGGGGDAMALEVVKMVGSMQNAAAGVPNAG